MSVTKRFSILSLMILCLSPVVYPKRIFRCPSACSCSKESIICVGSSSVPRIIPNDINSLSIVNGTFSEIKEAMFSHVPSLQLLFIESNKIETTSRYAFRGLRDLTHLSLANNNMKALPRDLFMDLDSLIEL
ncbi:hypothetical protein JZ751_016399 [Albula glossodonta]|uniref:Uncharacterized protein n=1 Tax=Albula glossodonta TaxID=121402 RepID=A0A8T2P166_9TELE|nr:hypothetical protein JZ751_016399 [Albula glossodonta]